MGRSVSPTRTVNDNSANFGAAVVGSGQAVSLTNCTVSGNTSGGGSAAVDNAYANLYLTNCQVSGNTGGGVEIFGRPYESPVPTLTVTDSSIENNTIDQSASGGQAFGAGIVSESADVTVTGSRIANNTASGSLALGAGISMETGFVKSAANVLTITDTTFEGNQAIGTGSYGIGDGGAIHTDLFATISVSDSSFVNNSATSTGPAQGGALDLEGLLQGSITGSLFAGNQAVASNASTLGATGGRRGDRQPQAAISQPC